jgi:hypothetical protein
MKAAKIPQRPRPANSLTQSIEQTVKALDMGKAR